MKPCIQNPAVRRAWLIVVAIASAASSAGMGQELGSAGTYEFERLWPNLPQPWYFEAPQCVGAGFDNSIYISDTRNFRIRKFTEDGQFLTEWGSEGTADGQFDLPSGIAVSSSGLVYVADTQGVQYFSEDGQFLGRLGIGAEGRDPIRLAAGIAIALDGTIYVSQHSKNRILRFDVAGKFLGEFGEPGKGDGQFDSPEGMAIDSVGRVYVADYWNHRVQRFSAKGEYLDQWGAFGSEANEFVFPAGIAISQAGNVYVTDSGNHRIQVFDQQWNLITSIGSKGSDIGAFRAPKGIAVDQKQNVYIVEEAGERVQKLDRRGNFIGHWGSSGALQGFLEKPKNCAVAPNGDILVADSGNSRVVRYDSMGRHVLTFGEAEAGEALPLLAGIAVSDTGEIYVSDANSDRIFKFNADGARLGNPWGGPGDTAGLFDGAGGIAIDANENLWIADRDNGRIQKFNGNGEYLGTIGQGGTERTRLQGPTDVAIAPSGNLFVADFYANRVLEFTPDDSVVNVWDKDSTPPLFLDGPEGIAVNTGGEVFIADSRNHQIQYLDPLDGYVEHLGQFGTDPGDFFLAVGIASGPDNRVYAVDRDNARIQVFRAAPKPRRVKALLVSGAAALEDEFGDAIRMCMNVAYRALVHQGLTKEQIFVISEDTGIDLDGNQVFDDIDGPASADTVSQAIRDWARDADTLLVYLAGGTSIEGFRLSNTAFLDPKTLDSGLDAFQAALATAIILIDAGGGAGYLESLAEQARPRILMASAGRNEDAYFATSGTLSFSNYFWLRVLNGSSFGDAYLDTRKALSEEAGYQTPYVDANGNGIPDEVGDFALISDLSAFNATPLNEVAPTIDSVSEKQRLGPDQNTAPLIASGVIDDRQSIARVWSLIRHPGGPSAGAGAIVVPPSAELEMTSLARYETLLRDFEAPGLYTVDIYAMDSNLNVSNVARTSVEKIANYALLRVIIYAESNGQLLEGVTVFLKGETSSLDHRTNNDGWCEFFPLWPGSYKIEIRHKGFKTIDSEIELDGEIQREYTLIESSSGNSPDCAASTSPPDTDPSAASLSILFLLSLLLLLKSVLRKTCASP